MAMHRCDVTLVPLNEAIMPLMDSRRWHGITQSSTFDTQLYPRNAFKAVLSCITTGDQPAGTKESIVGYLCKCITHLSWGWA